MKADILITHVSFSIPDEVSARLMGTNKKEVYIFYVFMLVTAKLDLKINPVHKNLKVSFLLLLSKAFKHLA